MLWLIPKESSSGFAGVSVLIVLGAAVFFFNGCLRWRSGGLGAGLG